MKKIIVCSFISLLIGHSVFAQSNIGESDPGFLTSMPPNTPALFSPENETTDLQDTVTVIWYSQLHTSTYTLQVSDTDSFQSLVINEVNQDTSSVIYDLEENTTHYWRVCASNVAGNSVFSATRCFTTALQSGVSDHGDFIPEQFALLPVYTNPFNPATTITYQLPERAEVSLVIYNNLGQSIRELVSGIQQAGAYSVVWDGTNDYHNIVSSGLYFCQYKAANHVFTQKIILIH